MTTAEQKINALFAELVPASGKADTVAGELVRAVSRIGYRNYNDGDHIGVGYGKQTCNPAARYLIKNGGDEVAVIVHGMWGMEADSLYDKAVEMLEEAVASYIERHPELKATPNSEDMWSYRDEREDVDDYDEEGRSMKLCDRCRVSGCLLNYLGEACQHARAQECPDVQPNRAELISNMSLDEMAEQLVPMFEELCEDGVPTPEVTRMWLLEEPEGREEEW